MEVAVAQLLCNHVSMEMAGGGWWKGEGKKEYRGLTRFPRVLSHQYCKANCRLVPLSEA